MSANFQLKRSKVKVIGRQKPPRQSGVMFTYGRPIKRGGSGCKQGRLSLSTMATNAPRTFWGGDFIKSLTLSVNIQKCEFCVRTY